jgi:hypothetical protein
MQRVGFCTTNPAIFAEQPDRIQSETEGEAYHNVREDLYIPHKDIKRGSAEQLKTGATSGNLVTSETSHTYIGTVFIVKSVLYKEI